MSFLRYSIYLAVSSSVTIIKLNIRKTSSKKKDINDKIRNLIGEP